MLFLLIVLSPSSCGAAVNADELSGPDLYNSRPFLDAWAYSVFRVWRSIGNSDKGNFPGYKSLVPVALPFLAQYLPSSTTDQIQNTDDTHLLDPNNINFEGYSYPESIKSSFRRNDVLGLETNDLIGLIIATCCSFILLLILWIGLIVYHSCWCCAQCCQCCAKCCNCCCQCCRVQKPCCTCGCWTDEGGKPCYKHFTRITYAILSILILFPIILICVSFFRIPSLLPALQMMMQKV